MRLAEALIERAALQRQVEQLQARIVQNARYQEGEEPAEDATALLAEVDRVLQHLTGLVVAINLTNAAIRTVDGEPVTAVLARRDELRRRHALLTAAADSAAGSSWGGARQLRSELRWMPALPVAQLRREADQVAKTLRDLEASIQRVNWEADLQQR